MYDDEFVDVKTILMGKYLDAECMLSIELKHADNFADSFGLWFEQEFFDKDKLYLMIKLSYLPDHFFSAEILSSMKFFMQFHDYCLYKTIDEKKSIYDNEEE